MKLRRSRGAFASIVLATGVVIASAQEPALANSKSTTDAEIGGKVNFELIRLKEGRLSVPLRYGSIKKASEQVDLNGRPLSRDKDYRIDYVSGSIVLTLNYRTGDSLRVSYRYDESAKQDGVYGTQPNANSFGGFTFNLNPNTSAYVGLGMTERLADGTTYSSDIFGLSNAFNLGGGLSLTGGWYSSSRSGSESMSMFNGAQGSQNQGGSGRALIQSLGGDLFGGKVSAYYQDIDERFSGFSAFSGQHNVNQLQKEKGLKRTMLSVDKVGSSMFNLSSGFASVGDSNGNKITSRSYGMNAGGLSVSWWSQEVDPGFTRFQDIGSQEFQQLQKERGLERGGLTAGMNMFGGKGAYASMSVSDLQGNGLQRESFLFDFGGTKLAFANQQVDEGFSRFGDLRGEWNPGQVAKERGLSRESFSLTTDKITGTPLNFSSTEVRAKNGEFKAQDFGLGDKRWSVNYTRREVDAGFGRMSSLAPDEINQHTAAALRATTNAPNVQGNDVNLFLNGDGLTREAWRAAFDMGKGNKISAHSVEIEGKADTLRDTGFSFESGKLSASFNQQDTGKDFTEGSRLMQTEQQRFSTIAGLDKTNMVLSYKDKGNTLSYDSMSASDLSGEALREKLKLQQKNFDFEVSRRSVTSGFSNVNALVDQERDILRSMLGQDTTEAKLSWSNLLPGMNLRSDLLKTSNSVLGQDGLTARSALQWNLDKLTSIQSTSLRHHQENGEEVLNDINQNNISVSRDLGNLGKFTVVNDTKKFDGTQDKERDSKTNALIYETKLNSKTSLRSENSRTEYETGEREISTSNTVSTELSKNLGVSVTQTQIKRDGDAKDEEYRNFGFWYDFGKGIKLKYGYVRKTADEVGTSNADVSLSGGEAAGLKFGGANYKHDGWDGQRDKHVGGLSLASAKPLTFGAVRDFQFYYNLSTDRDYGLWKREDKSMGLSAMYAGMAFGFDYKSQVDREGQRAIDRFFSLSTDKTGKAPVRATLTYGIRTMPSDDDVFIRNYEFVYKPKGNFSLQHNLMTNPLKAVPNVLLGSSITPTSRTEWTLNWTGDRHTNASLFWKEDVDIQKNLFREGGVLVKLFADNASPLTLKYGVAQKDVNGIRDTRHTFGLLFNQRPGPNQSLSLMMENLNWEDGRPADFTKSWQVRLDYSVRF